MIPALLVFLAGATSFVALLHFLTGVRAESRRRNLLMGSVGLVLSAYMLLSAFLYQTRSLQGYRQVAKGQGAVSVLLILLVWWFVAEYTDVRPRALLLSVTALMGFAFVANLVSPDGLFFGHVSGLRMAPLPWGERVTTPVATPNPLEWLVNVSFLGVLVFSAFAITRQYRRGAHRDAILLAVAIVAVATPTFLDIFVLGVDVFPFPFTETGFTLWAVLLSLSITDGAVKLGRVQQALRASELRARALVAEAPDGIALVDPAGPRLVDLNPAGRRMLGLGEGTLPENLLQVSPESQPDGSDSVGVVRPRLIAAANGETQYLEWTFRRPDGREFPAEVWLAPLSGEDGSKLVRVSFVDITDRKESAQREEELALQLRQAQKIETIGTLAGGIAHDFNNLLTPITGFVQLAREDLDEASPVQESLEAVAEAADRARELVQQILVFSRRSPPLPGICCLAEAARGAMKLLEAGKPASVELITSLDLPDGFVALGETQVHQIVMNLATNAVHAMPDGGMLRIAVERKGASGVEPSSLVLTVADTGTGIAPDILQRVFDPFFTTKPTGVGTGLGLSVVHGIVTGAGGHIDLDSRLGEGTTIRVTLPEHAQEAARPRGAPSSGAEGPKKVLIVEDDLSSLEALRRMVSTVGHQPAAESDPIRALQRIESSPDGFDLVMVGYDMPAMNGAAFARRLKALRPDLPTLCISGAALPQEVLQLFDGVVPKPITLDQMREALGTPARIT